MEGSAEYDSIRYLTDRYGIDWNFYVSIYEIGLDRDLPPLGTGARNLKDFSASYTEAFLALESLLGDRPLARLRTYFEDSGRIDREDAFQHAFDLDPEEFLRELEAQIPELLLRGTRLRRDRCEGADDRFAPALTDDVAVETHLVTEHRGVRRRPPRHCLAVQR